MLFMKKNLRVILFCICICILVMTMLLRIGKPSLPKPLYGQPVITTEYIDFSNQPISMIVDDGSYMYVLFDEINGYIQVYDLDGKYQHTISFYESLNGGFQIASVGSTVYVCDKELNLYVYEDGQLATYLVGSEADALRKTIGFSNFSQRYEIRGASVWRVDGEEDVCVIERGFLSYLYQNSIVGIICVVLFSLLFISVVVAEVLDKKRKRVAET